MFIIFSQKPSIQEYQSFAELNELEIAVLKYMSISKPALKPLIISLKVASRENTLVGGYTNLFCNKEAAELGDKLLGLDAHIFLPTVPNGLGAVLCCENNKPQFIEFFTYSSETWLGETDGVSIEEAQ